MNYDNKGRFTIAAVRYGSKEEKEMQGETDRSVSLSAICFPLRRERTARGTRIVLHSKVSNLRQQRQYRFFNFHIGAETTAF